MYQEFQGGAVNYYWGKGGTEDDCSILFVLRDCPQSQMWGMQDSWTDESWPLFEVAFEQVSWRGAGRDGCTEEST